MLNLIGITELNFSLYFNEELLFNFLRLLFMVGSCLFIILIDHFFHDYFDIVSKLNVHFSL